MRKLLPIVLTAAAFLTLIVGTDRLTAQSTKRPGADITVNAGESWNSARLCVDAPGLPADVGLERSGAGLFSVTDCGGATSSTNLRAIQAAFFNNGASTIIASAATIAPTNSIHHVSGTAAIATITVPTFCTPTCVIQLIPDGVFTTTNAGNISIASTAVVNKVLEMVWDGTKWNPSY
jgi:hypothetical protein